MTFSDQLLNAIGAWQKGWRENQSLREQLADDLKKAVCGLPPQFLTVITPCYRKRFLHKGELVELILMDHRDEGLVSWTTKREFAEIFKGLYRRDAVSGAIFRHDPVSTDVVLNIQALWECSEFVTAAQLYQNRNGENATALFNFSDNQGEVVLSAPLRASEIVALTGASSPFDDLCDGAGIAPAERDQIYRSLLDQGIYPGEYQYISEEAAQRAISATIKKMHEKISALKIRY